MNTHSLKVLEYRQIQEMLAEHASSDLGKEVIEALARRKPSEDPDPRPAA